MTRVPPEEGNELHLIWCNARSACSIFFAHAASSLIALKRRCGAAWSGEPEGAASRGQLIPFGRLPGVPVDTRLPPTIR